MDTIVFALILASALIIIFVKKRWIVVLGFAVAFVASAALFAHHVTSTLDLSF
ncbi:uncharacterized protein involved in exopolysaccharide biosynthesis [Aurantimicrobium minutum]|uniref:DUF5993 family protein n=1 Tax=Aurantimicrobium minutum TaxID=708131 RepID=UPI002474C9B5|nr:DUF5993 family protein [Aurantimicrobium minutum]MDH6532414.1 uncharacterized protein involved in exopolysaccharide biosynthesis [Aurantimicrobium minutum]